MSVESADKVKKAYQELISIAKQLGGELDEQMEKQLIAEFQIQYGFGKIKTSNMIENLVLTGRIARKPVEKKE